MESQNRTLRKRKQPSSSSPPPNSNPFAGILTRHKSQKFFFHHNRSGKSRRSSSFPSSLSNPNLPINQRLLDCNTNNVFIHSSANTMHHASIKDLRAHRVFSKPYGLDAVVKSESPKLDETGENPSLLKRGECDSGVELNGGNPNSSTSGVRSKDEMSPSLGGKDLEGNNGEHCDKDVQTTPPDVEVLAGQNVLQKRGADTRSPPKQISPDRNGKKSFPTYRRNLGLNPCSRLKAFKATNSFSFRRMLPFLLDISNDKPSAPKVKPSIKIETDVVEYPFVSSSQEIGVDHPKLDERPLETAVACELEAKNESKEEESLYLDLTTNDSHPQQASPCTTIICPIDNSQEIPVSDDDQTGTPVSDSIKDGGDSPDRLVSLDNISPVVELGLADTLHSPKRSSEVSDENGTKRTPSHLSLSSERECRTSQKESKSEEFFTSMLHGSSKLDYALSPAVSDFCQVNGILKRNPRGCRGICDCLHCSTFRLNAERAFEFSKNQLLDAEELAMDLMKELSNLRCMIEKSTTGANDNSIVSFDQVQEVCRRAIHAEDIARSRLKQMNEDLQVHCRTKPLLRPGVNFASSVQEKDRRRN